jgi:hypothetical protein
MDSEPHAPPSSVETRATAVLHLGGLNYASEKAVVEQVLARRPGVLSIARLRASPSMRAVGTQTSLHRRAER